MTVREPEWSRGDLDLLLAHRDTEPLNALGIPLSVATDPANQFRFIVPELPSTDWAEKAWRDAQDKYYKANESMSRNGHLWRLPALMP